MVLKAKHILLWLIILISHLGYSQKTIKDLYKLYDEQFKTGKYDEALITSIKVLQIAEKGNNCKEIATALLNVGRMEYYIIHKQLAIFLKVLKCWTTARMIR